MHDRLGKWVSIHDRLGGRTMIRDPAGRRVSIHDRLEKMADEVQGKGSQEDAGRSSAPHRLVTSKTLLNKFQRDRERQQRKEEEEHHEKEHWRCPFFLYCWEEGLTLPSAYDCPECNGQGSRSYKS